MSAAKKSRPFPILPAWLRNLLVLIRGPGRTTTAIVLLVAGFAAGTTLVWAEVKDRVLASGRYAIAQQNIHVTPLPPWIHGDVRAEVFRNASLDARLSILDDDVAERVANAFALHPWVAKVLRVTKRAPHHIDVELAYRQPACMVEVARGEVLPVDVAGVLLPSGDFSPIEKLSYPRLGGVETRPMGPAGQRWGDSRVVDGAEIAAALASAWQQLRLFRIVATSRSGGGAGEEPVYELRTTAGTRILWGLAPNSKSPGEIPAAEKAARLAQYFADHGTLDLPAGQVLDVRLLPAARPRT